VLGGISIKAIKLMIAILALGLFLATNGSAIDYGHHEGDPSYDHTSDGPMHAQHADHSWNHDYDWLSPGGSYYNWYYPTAYYYDWYYTPTYTYYPTYYYIEPIYYTTPVYYSTPVTYYDWVDPWWAANVYGFGGITHYYSSSWTYHSGFGFGDP
jgi:hypothetical protein